jgi:cohesin complex subunit SA-1/2
LVALKIINQLCIVGEQNRIELSTTTRQITAEKKKRSPNTDRLRILKKNHTIAESRCKDLEEYLTEFFESIFVHRSRDVESVIRNECYKELCNWMLNYQNFFVDNAYLRYYGWAFNDQSASVRSETIKSLIKLYKVESIASKLSTFTNRFMPRIEEMALFDVDVSVRVNAIQLCSALFKIKVNVLSEKGRKQLSNMIASDVPRVRKSAAPFVKALIDTNIIDPLVKSVTESLSGGRRSQSTVTVNKTWVTFKAIASFLVEQSASILEKENDNEMQLDLESLSSTLAEKRNAIITNIVEALWDQMPELQDYVTLSDYLSRDHSQSQQEDDVMDTGNDIEDCYRLSEDEETVLINVFVTCIRTAMVKGLDKNMPEGVKDKRKLDSTFWEENKNELSRHLVQVLPKLLSKHSDDTNRITQLVTVPALMNLNVYLELRAEQEYEELLQKLVKVYLGAILTELLTNCADSLQHMSKNAGLIEINKLHMSDLTEAVVNQVRDVCSGKDLVTANYTPALIHSVSVSMLRLACLINFTDATTAMDDAQGLSMNVTDYVGALVDRAVFGYEKEKNISLSALAVLSRYMMWKCNALGPSSNASEVVPVIERRRDWVIDKFSEIVKGVDVTPLHDIRVAAYGYLVDIYWLFTSDLFATFGLNRLKIKCPSDLQKACVDYFVQEVAAVKNADEKAAAEQKEALQKLTTAFSRGVLMGVFDISYTAVLLEQYGLNDTEMDDTVKALVTEFQADLISGEVAADGICRAYLTALKNVSLNKQMLHLITNLYCNSLLMSMCLTLVDLLIKQ